MCFPHVVPDGPVLSASDFPNSLMGFGSTTGEVCSTDGVVCAATSAIYAAAGVVFAAVGGTSAYVGI